MLDRVEPTGQQAKLARGVITRQVTHLRRLVDDLLDVTRIGRAKITVKRPKLDLVDLAGVQSRTTATWPTGVGQQVCKHLGQSSFVAVGGDT